MYILLQYTISIFYCNTIIISSSKYTEKHYGRVLCLVTLFFALQLTNEGGGMRTIDVCYFNFDVFDVEFYVLLCAIL